LGVLRDVDDADSLIEEIRPETYRELREQGVVNKGMIPKIDNAFRAVEAGVQSVTIKHSDNLLSNKGTVIKL
jgi:acetylglutamate kinase